MSLGRHPNAVSIDQRARALAVSREAVELLVSSHAIDLHIDTFIWDRLFGYQLGREHGTGLFDARLFGQADVPRCVQAGLTGAYFIITTNPLRSRRGRRDVCLRNIATLTRHLLHHPKVAMARSLREYEAARAEGKLSAFVGLQGGNALALDLDDFDNPLLSCVSLITLLHFTRSRLGAPALPALLKWGDQHLTAFGAEYVRTLNRKRILVDLAHISPAGFWDVVKVHEPGLPLTVSHAGCAAVFPHFRNLDDRQLRAVADTGGVVGVLFHCDFLGSSRSDVSVETVVDHIAHVVRTVGADYVALGSDFDGAIIPPRDLKTVRELPRLVDALLRRGLCPTTVQKVLGENFLRVLRTLRP